MRYFLDTEFIEGPQRKKLLGFNYGWTKPTIDLISIGMVAEDGMEYYAVSKDFNLAHAWENEWIVNNVLLPIYKENIHGDYRDKIPFTYSGMKQVLKMVGKTNKQIAKDIELFVFSSTADRTKSVGDPVGAYADHTRDMSPPEFWAYYADYDWVVFCQLFGRMIDLPDGFPMYCRDLKQLMDEMEPAGIYDYPFNITSLKEHPKFPHGKNKHHALIDAREDRDLYKFLTNL